ncbi:MAG: Ig-like domain repeat protein [Terracidiphilus sp.]
MKRLVVSAAWTATLTLGLGVLAGCGGSSTPAVASISSFVASPAKIAAGESSSLTGVFTNGTGAITPGNLAVSSGTPVNVSPATTATYTLTVTPSSGTAVTATATVTVNPPIVTPTVTVTPGSSSITTAQALAVNVTVSGPAGEATPTGSVTLTSGSYTSAAATLSSGSATINVPAGSLAMGSDTLTVTYTPDTTSSPIYSSATGTNSVTVTKVTPAVTVTPSLLNIGTTQPLTATVAVSGPSGEATPTGTVTLSSGSYTSTATNLSGGSATINIPGGSLAAGSDVLTASYTPDSASSSIYNPATGTSPAVTVTAPSTVTVSQPSTPLAVTDQIIGMNMAVWYDIATNKTAIVDAFGPVSAGGAGIKAVRWPGGSTSDVYHWANNSYCASYANPNSTFSNFVNDLAVPAGLDVALTADYGTDVACTGPGQPSEAAAWVANALTLGITVSHMTVGNEEYGTWETDLHTAPHDPTTYADAVAGAGGYYDLIKAASPSTLVGVVVSPGYNWDPTVLADAPYDFVEYHYYPETPGDESDTFLVQQAAQALTTDINTIKLELKTAGNPDTPIYVGEIGGPYSNPGKQSWSITQGLYAGQVLGEMMNDGVSRLTWWIGFGNCNTSGTENDSASLYGWQDFGAYNVFSDGPSDSDCPGAGPVGTMSPTARAFELFSNVAVTGENVLSASVAGDTTDVVAYAATNSGGTAVVVFNRNETTSEPVVITIPQPASATTVTVETYDKAIYDLSGSPTGTPPDPDGTSTWAPPTTTNISSPALPLTLTLTPWSMNVVMIH